MNGDEIIDVQLRDVKFFVNESGFLSRLINALDRGINHDGRSGMTECFFQACDMVRQKPVIVIQKNQKVAFGGLQSDICRFATSQAPVAVNAPQRKSSAPVTNGVVSLAFRVDQNDFNIRISLQRDRIQRVRQCVAIHAADNHADQRKIAGICRQPFCLLARVFRLVQF